VDFTPFMRLMFLGKVFRGCSQGLAQYSLSDQAKNVLEYRMTLRVIVFIIFE